MATWSVQYGADELQLSDRNPYDIISVQGIGVPTVRRLSERGPFQDGDSDVGYRLDPRLINVVMLMTSASRAAADADRDTLFQYFKPNAGQLGLRCIRDDGTLRQIDCAPVGVLDAPVTDLERIGPMQKFAVQLRAAEPIWFDPQIHYWAAIGGSSTGLYGFAVPIAIPWVQAPLSAINLTTTVAYAGSWRSYPILKIFGPANGVTISNISTGDVLDFPTLTLTAGHWIEIDLRYGRKTLLDDLGANRISELSSDSDLATWHLAPAPDVPLGQNIIHLQVDSSATDATGVQMAYYDRFVAL